MQINQALLWPIYNHIRVIGISDERCVQIRTQRTNHQ